MIDYIQNHQGKWKEHVKRINAGRIAKQILRNQPKGQRPFGRPVKENETVTSHLA
jgi:hypothetical protein